MTRIATLAALLLLLPHHGIADTTRFCLEGAFNLGARYQGLVPDANEFTDMRWCVITETESLRVRFEASGKSNPDMDSSWTVALVPPDLVRIVNADAPPDIEFNGADDVDEEARRYRRMDPYRLIEEINAHPDWQSEMQQDGWRDVHYPGEATTIRVQRADGRLLAIRTIVDLPLRGRVPVLWRWNWSEPENPAVVLEVDGTIMMFARGSRERVSATDAPRLWQSTPGGEPVQVPGQHWPARVNMQKVELAEGVFLVTGVRTGFRHLVVKTSTGLVVADAPAGWVELHQIPPADLVPGLGISGLSRQFVDFLAESFPDTPIRAVALTHAHDDHAGGARAFAAAGADIYAPAEYEQFLETALNRDGMPPDRLSRAKRNVDIKPVTGELLLADADQPVRLIAIGAGPHSSASLGVRAESAGVFFVSDIHVPRSEAAEPRQDRAQTECWFARWAAAHLDNDDVIVNSHSAVRTPVTRLEDYLKSPACGSSPAG